MQKPIVTIRLIDEVYMQVFGLHGDHHKILYTKYSIFKEGYFFNPKFKLGVWNGKINNYGADGKTFLYLIEEILPMIMSWGYDIKIDDRRQTHIITPSLITSDIFSGINHPDTGNPIILRDDQVDGVNALITAGHGLCIAGTGAGKAQPLYSKVLTTNGWKSMGDMRVNDQIITPSGRLASVTGVFPQPTKDIYTITFHDGATVEACAEHLWAVNFEKCRRSHKSNNQIITTQDIVNFLDIKNQTHVNGNITIPTIHPVAYPAKMLSLDPYLLGVIIGNGPILPNEPLLVCFDSDITSKVEYILRNMGESITFTDGVCSQVYPPNLLSTNDNTAPHRYSLFKAIRDMKMFNLPATEMFIPTKYRFGTIEQRLNLLRGILDISGCMRPWGHIQVSTLSISVAQSIQDIIWSLGGVCTITTTDITHMCDITIQDPHNLFTSTIKLSKYLKYKTPKTITRRIVSAKKTSFDKAQCIMIDDPNRLYITDNYVITHNTFMCAALVTAYNNEGIRSLTIVPDQTLIKQTKRDYILVGLDTGEYSGTTKTLGHSHIVSTWQALKNNPKIILSFNMIIVDECHGLRGISLRNMITDQAARIPYRFGFTGTLPKAESDRLEVQTSLGPIRHTMPAIELIEKGVLAQLRITMIELAEDLTSQYKTYCDECIATPIPYKLFKQNYFPDYASEQSYIKRNPHRLEWIADCVELQRDAAKGNTLCLVTNIQIARALHKLIPGSYIVNGVDLSDPKKRQEVYELFSQRNDLVVIATIQIAGTGLSINRIFNLVLIDVGKSFIRVIQAIGRGLRKSHDKEFVNVIDISSDLKFGRQHALERVRIYKEAKYPHTQRRVKYTKP